MWGWTNRAERRLQQRRVMREGAWEGEGHREERQRWRERGRDGENRGRQRRGHCASGDTSIHGKR